MLNGGKVYSVVGIGEILWDLMPDGKQLGGAPANFAYHARKLGASAYIISSIGNDQPGREILKNLDRIDLSTKYISLNKIYPTGSVDVKLNAQGEPAYDIRKNVAWDFLTISDSVLNLAKISAAICFGSLAQRSITSYQWIHEIINATADECLRIFDINIRQSYYDSEKIEKSLILANSLKLNQDEFLLLSDIFNYGGSVENIISTLISQFNLKLIALTKGEKGSDLFTESGHSSMNAPKVQVIDTIGAGDAFTAALCMGWLNKYSLENIHQKATRLAAFVCTRKGATPDLPEKLRRELIHI